MIPLPHMWLSWSDHTWSKVTVGHSSFVHKWLLSCAGWGSVCMYLRNSGRKDVPISALENYSFDVFFCLFVFSLHDYLHACQSETHWIYHQKAKAVLNQGLFFFYFLLSWISFICFKRYKLFICFNMDVSYTVMTNLHEHQKQNI